MLFHPDCVHDYALIGNGYCNDETNNADCLYDGGDCCGSSVITDHCTECACEGDSTGWNILALIIY